MAGRKTAGSRVVTAISYRNEMAERLVRYADAAIKRLFNPQAAWFVHLYPKIFEIFNLKRLFWGE